MKIVITGTHSSGKTTLARACSEHFKIPFLRGDTVREIMQRHFPGEHFYLSSDQDRWRREKIVLAERIKAEESKTSFVADGCTLNSIAYVEATIGRAIKDINEYKNFCKIALENAKKYDFIFYLPPEIPLERDNFRPTEDSFRMAVDQKLAQVLRKVSFFEVRGDVSSRLRRIKDIIES